MKRDILENVEKEIEKLELTNEDRTIIYRNIAKLREQKLNILITGATGSGKSSTINAMFDMEIAKVAYGVDPETMDIEKFELDNLTLWDSPGLGDGKEADNRHSKNIINKLYEKDSSGNGLIDLVLVILDGSSRDMGTSFKLINDVIIPNIGNTNRILVAINQCDVAMKGKYWDSKNKKPEIELENFLKEKVDSVKRRVKDSTGVDIEPIFYSASEYYNISKLFSFILKYTPKDKRAVYIDKINNNKDIWEKDDELEDYRKEIKKSLMESLKEGIEKGTKVGSEIGGSIGKIIGGKVGEKIGTVIGAVGGAVIGAIGGFLDSIFG